MPPLCVRRQPLLRRLAELVDPAQKQGFRLTMQRESTIFTQSKIGLPALLCLK